MDWRYHQALLANGDHARVYDVQLKVLMELTVHRGLCIPVPEHRSKELTRALHSESLLRDAMGQVILPPDSAWIVESTRPADETGWARITLTQVA